MVVEQVLTQFLQLARQAFGHLLWGKGEIATELDFAVKQEVLAQAAGALNEDQAVGCDLAKALNDFFDQLAGAVNPAQVTFFGIQTMQPGCEVVTLRETGQQQFFALWHTSYATL